MNPIEIIKEKTKKYSDLKIEEKNRYISVQPSGDSTFPVSFSHDETEFIVGYDYWHEHFESQEEALECFAFGLSDKCRIKVDYAGKTPYKWLVQYYENGIWHDESSCGILIYPFWRKKSTKLLQNTLIKD